MEKSSKIARKLWFFLLSKISGFSCRCSIPQHGLAIGLCGGHMVYRLPAGHPTKPNRGRTYPAWSTFTKTELERSTMLIMGKSMINQWPCSIFSSSQTVDITKGYHSTHLGKPLPTSQHGKIPASPASHGWIDWYGPNHRCSSTRYVTTGCLWNWEHEHFTSEEHHVYSCLFMVIHVYSCLFMVIHGYSCLFMVIHGYSWLFMFIHGYSCLFMWAMKNTIPSHSTSWLKTVSQSYGLS